MPSLTSMSPRTAHAVMHGIAQFRSVVLQVDSARQLNHEKPHRIVKPVQQ